MIPENNNENRRNLNPGCDCSDSPAFFAAIAARPTHDKIGSPIYSRFDYCAVSVAFIYELNVKKRSRNVSNASIFINLCSFHLPPTKVQRARTERRARGELRAEPALEPQAPVLPDLARVAEDLHGLAEVA